MLPVLNFLTFSDLTEPIFSFIEGSVYRAQFLIIIFYLIVGSGVGRVRGSRLALGRLCRVKTQVNSGPVESALDS